MGGVDGLGDQAQFTTLSAFSGSRSHTPVTSYLPTGRHDSPLPQGKYYPSNWENRVNGGQQSPPRPPPSTSVPNPARPDLLVPQSRNEAAHTRSNSDAKRRLQQYKRDMIAQATLAANEILSGTETRGGGPGVPSLAGISQANAQLGQSIAQKPVSPQLVPLGSPGPVTPMELEGTDGTGGDGAGGGGYLTRGRPATGWQVEYQDVEISRAIRAEDGFLGLNRVGSAPEPSTC